MEIIKLDKFSAYFKIKKDLYRVLDEISLDVEEGEFLVIVGPSGCGKTTLLRSILGFTKMTTGTLLLNGKDVNKIDISKQNVGYVSQEYGLYPSMTVYENIAYPLKAMHCSPSEIDSRVKEIAKKLKLLPFLTRKPKQLSGGQHQRVAIARALIKEPRLVLFDEPFSNLEPPMRLELNQLVKELHNEQRTTFLFVTHDLTEAFLLADRIAVMSNEKIEQVATPKELENNPKSKWVAEFLRK